MKLLSKFILYTLLRWKIIGDFPLLKKYVIIVAPHTSWVDFPLAVLVKFAKGLQVNYIGKKSLFRWPFGFFFRMLGGEPVDRSKNHNMVQSIVDIFNTKEDFVFALAPEGTRKKVSSFKSGFYHVAKGAQVPLVMVALDFKNKEIRVAEPFYTSDDERKDFDTIYSYFRGVQGKKPEFSF